MWHRRDDEVRELASRVELVWHGVNDPANLGAFLASGVHWGEVDVRTGPAGDLILRHDSFEHTPPRDNERPFLLADCLAAIQAAGRAAKLDLKECGDVSDRALAVAAEAGFDESKLWFNSDADCLGEAGFRRLRRRYPNSTITCPAGPLATSLLDPSSGAEDAGGSLARLRDWGVSRLSVPWSTPGLDQIVEVLAAAGWEVNVYKVADLSEFLAAAQLAPKSLTADFNFPEWGLNGRGSGARDDYP